MIGHGAKFGRKKEEAVAAMLTQRNIEEAARATGVSTANLMRWQKLPEFQSAYRKARRAAFGQAGRGYSKALLPQLLVSCPGDFVRSDSSFGIGVGPAEGPC